MLDQDPQAQLFAALAKAQAEFPAIPKNRTVTIRHKSGAQHSFRYAELDTIIAATRPALSKHGLSVLQPIDGDKLTTVVTHEGGGTIKSVMQMPHMEADLKIYGAALSYLRRYQYQAMLCLAPDDDIDEITELPSQLTDEQKETADGFSEQIAAAQTIDELKALTKPLAATKMPDILKKGLRAEWTARRSELEEKK